MSFINEILSYKSISIIGMAKNAGKTECLNYILGRVKDSGKQIAITSIGLDGETQDQVTQTAKPEIKVYEGMIFITSEKHYKEKKILAEILDVSTRQTALGRLITARALNTGKILLSGPADTDLLKRVIRKTDRWNVNTTLVDGALSRTSLGSPAVTDAMVLATGASVSRTIPELVRKTHYLYELIKLENVETEILNKLNAIESGVWAIDKKGEIHDLHIPSILMLESYKDKLFKYGSCIYVAGIISDNFLQFLRMQKQIKDTVLIVRDFTRVFASMDSYYAYLKKGGQIRVLLKTHLLAISINPFSPEGYSLNSDVLKKSLEDKIGVPVYDIRKLKAENQNR